MTIAWMLVLFFVLMGLGMPIGFAWGSQQLPRFCSTARCRC